MKLLIVIGSLRAAAFSRKIGDAVASQIPEGVDTRAIDGRELPLYDQDLDGDEKPEAVQRLLDQVSEADAILFVTPEFNYGLPGPLKNLIDWASRPAYNSPLKGKPALVISHSIAPTGGARAHSELNIVLSGTLTPTFVAPSFVIPSVHEKFDEAGTLTDELTKLRLDGALAEFIRWAETFGG